MMVFLLHVNNLPEGLKSCLDMFAYDVNVMRVVRNDHGCNNFQRDLDSSSFGQIHGC